MNKLICIIVFLLTCRICDAQNLVPNGDFETHTSCPSFFSQINLATPWMTPSTGSPDYYNQCSTFYGTGIPNNNWGFQYAHGGDAYCGILLYQLVETNVREYIEVTLADTLQANNCYHFEMHVNLGNQCHYTSNDIQVYFSDTILSGISNYLYIPKPFQISYTGVIFDSLAWTLVSGDYTAVGGERFLTIGNFKDDSSSNIILLPNNFIQTNVYVYIDDVSLSQIPCNVGINETNYSDASFTFYPNPFTDRLSFKIENNLFSEIILYDIASRKILHQKFTNTVSLNTEQLANGLYIYEVRSKDGSYKKGKVVKD